ncbi:DUF4136 domain-containing protein [Myxococcus sp. AM001]|nr:DUF4136 domain-containing protein [Myxococcus sp. AM001]
MRLLFRITPVLLGLALAACSGIRVNTNYDPSAVERIEDFRRYAWLPQPQGKDARVYNDIVDVRVRMAVDQELKARGYQKVDMGADPDFFVGWQGAIDTKVSIDTVDSFYGYPWGPYWSPWSSFYGPYGYPYGMGGPRTYVREYDVGTLILDGVDAREQRLVWRGTAQAELHRDLSPDELQKKINDAVHKLLSRFPPKPGAS